MAATRRLAAILAADVAGYSTDRGGEPTEKVCGSKPVYATKGDYDDADAFISYHPHFTNTAIRDTQCGSYWSAVFTFETIDPEKWIDESLIPTTHSSHAAARCPVRSTRSV